MINKEDLHQKICEALERNRFTQSMLESSVTFTPGETQELGEHQKRSCLSFYSSLVELNTLINLYNKSFPEETELGLSEVADQMRFYEDFIVQRFNV